MSDTESSHEVKRLKTPKSYLNVIEILLSSLSRSQLNLIRRAYRLNQPSETDDSPLIDESALIFHAVTVGLTQLMKAINSSGIYHQSVELEISSILHSS